MPATIIPCAFFLALISLIIFGVQFETWLVNGVVLSLDMTLSTIGSGPGEFLEIWRFGIQSHPPENGKSSMYAINGGLLSAEMSDLLRSIEHSCSFLVGIPPNCKFDIDVCCDSSASASEFWTHAAGNLLGVEKISGRTIKVRLLACAAFHSPPSPLTFVHSLTHPSTLPRTPSAAASS